MQLKLFELKSFKVSDSEDVVNTSVIVVEADDSVSTELLTASALSGSEGVVDSSEDAADGSVGRRVGSDVVTL